MTGWSWPVSMLADFELRREIEAGGDGSADAAAELAARHDDRRRVRGIDPQATLIAHHAGAARPRPEAGRRPAGRP
jgi:hypothetical protein